MQQTYQNHAKLVPAYHFFVAPILLANVVVTIIRVAHHFDFYTAFQVLLALALLTLAFLARTFALKVQDRVIRLEMRLRLRELLPADLQSRIEDFSPSQLIGMRFASDRELPELARKVVSDNIQDRSTIKQLVQNWQPDDLRL
jgi:Family of unknown function (DUF6526)